VKYDTVILSFQKHDIGLRCIISTVHVLILQKHDRPH